MKSSAMPPARTSSTRAGYQRPSDTEKSQTAKKFQELNIATPYGNSKASEHGSLASDQSRTPTQGAMGSFKMNVQQGSCANLFPRPHTLACNAVVQMLSVAQIRLGRDLPSRPQTKTNIKSPVARTHAR